MASQTTYVSTELAPEADELFERGVRAARAWIGDQELLIGGRRVAGGGGRLEERNPARLNEPLGSYAVASTAQVAEAVEVARAAQPDWARRPAAQRLTLLSSLAEALERHAGELAALLALEVGKNRVESMGEVDEAVELIRFYGARAVEGFDLPLAAADPAHRNVSRMRPFGAFGVIAPFNFPLALVLGPSAAALLAGNTVVAKPSPTTSGIGVRLWELARDAGIPDGVFNVVTGGDGTGRALVASGVDGLVFTGSHEAGRQIAARFLSQAPYARPCILEMGGKNPAIVTAGADLEKAAAGIARSAWGLSGQKCSACSRVLVHEAVHDELVDLLAGHAAEWRPSDPLEPGCRLGPVHTADAHERFQALAVQARTEAGIAAGGRALSEGPLADGYYVEPTIVTDVPPHHPLIAHEHFVPLLTIERVRSLDEALVRANDQVYGLTAGFFGEDPGEVEQFLEGIEAGTIFVNRPAGATSGGWPGQQTYPGWKGSGSTGRGALGPRYVEQFLREQGVNVVP